jgi:SPP1 gp7 family putative phage head morphogenesis protein
MSLSSSFWDGERDLLYQTLFPLVRDAALAGAKTALDGLVQELGIGVDWGLVNEAAMNWARDYTFDMVSGVNDTSKRFLQQAISDWIASGQPLDVLMEAIQPMFGSVRAEMIAISEVTRAFAEGNLTTWEQSGVVDEADIMTAEDELVCPICGEAAGNGPYTLDVARDLIPLHTRCRCWWRPIYNAAKAAFRQMLLDQMAVR